MSDLYFSCCLRFLIFVGDKDCQLANDQVYIIASQSFDEAFERALILGGEKEKRYTNGSNETVLWKFARVISLDALGGVLLDGVEVYSQPVNRGQGETWPSQSELSPKSFNPIQTI